MPSSLDCETVVKRHVYPAGQPAAGHQRRTIALDDLDAVAHFHDARRHAPRGDAADEWVVVDHRHKHLQHTIVPT